MTALPMIYQDAVVPPGAKLERLFAGGTRTEGPAMGPDGSVYFCDDTWTAIPGPRRAGHVRRFDPKTGRTTVFRSPSGQANGLRFDAEGRLLLAESADGGGRRITRTDMTTGEATILADRFREKPLNSPNDLALARDGAILFSDPRYQGAEPVEQPVQGVYRIAPDGTLSLIVADAVPNGIALSPDERTLYVADLDLGSLDFPRAEPGARLRKRMRLLAYDVLPSGRTRMRAVLADYGTEEEGADSLTTDSAGRIYAAVRAASRPGVRIYSPEGRQVGEIPTPEIPTNMGFARDDGMLYITAGSSLYRIRTNARGNHVPFRTEAGRRRVRR